MDIFCYRKLVVYQKSKELVKRTYKLVERFPSKENFALCSQLRRASVSVTSNIAEGISRFNIKEKKHFIEIAYGSLMEVYAQLDIAHDLGYLNNETFNQVESDVEEISKMISAMASLRSIPPASRL